MIHDLVPVLTRAEAGSWSTPEFGRTPLEHLLGGLERFVRPVASRCGPNAPGFVPRVDIDEKSGAVRLRAEMPGLAEGDFEVLFDGEVLTIAGERKDQSKHRNRGYRRVETIREAFQRQFRLPFETDLDAVEATFKDGILEVIVSKPEATQPKARDIRVMAA